MQNVVPSRSTFLPAFAAVLVLLTAVAPAPVLGAAAEVGVIEVSVDPAFPAAFGQELKLRVRVSNRGAVAARGVALEARVGTLPVGRMDIGQMGPGEQRTITLATRFKPSGAECVSVAPILAPDSPVKAGAGRLACLTPGCYSLSERPGN